MGQNLRTSRRERRERIVRVLTLFAALPAFVLSSLRADVLFLHEHDDEGSHAHVFKSRAPETWPVQHDGQHTWAWDSAPALIAERPIATDAEDCVTGRFCPVDGGLLLRLPNGEWLTRLSNSASRMLLATMLPTSDFAAIVAETDPSVGALPGDWESPGPPRATGVVRNLLLRGHALLL
ncbi:MAG: hypothetical protein C4547_15160 [Phycisphaerales bacterium]|nr:MAG: hypothetical protein C4547_15160 [Phycisphaerales bacterium]